MSSGCKIVCTVYLHVQYLYSSTVSCSISGHRYIELFLLSRPGGGGGGREGGEFGGRGGMRGGASGGTRYPTQASWTDPRDTQVIYHVYVAHVTCRKFLV